MTFEPNPELRMVDVSLPFAGRWKVENSPKRRVPSHGTAMLGTAYAIDFVGVDDHDRAAPGVSWRTAFATEPPEQFFAFGREILAPVTGTVAAVHQGEQDHDARRSPLTLLPYALGQASRLRQGLGKISGNSTQPHVHLQAMDRLDPWTAQALPLRIRRYYEKPFRSQRFFLQENTIPGEGSTVEAAR